MRNPLFVTHPPGQMWALLCAVPLSVLFLGGCVDPSLDATVTLDPTMVTRAFVHVDADPSVRAHVVYGDKNTDEATWAATPKQTGGALDFVLYLHGGASSSFRVEGTDARGHAVSGPLQDVTTDALPRMLPNFRSTSCDPECRHDGVCANGLCFCKSPWGGDYCENDLKVHSRVSLVMALILTFLFAAGGFLTPFVLRFIYDCFCARREQAAEDEGEGWKP